MIIASVKEGLSQKEFLKFRGFTLSYWIKKIFNQVPFHDISDIPGGFDFMLYFDENLFLDIPSDGFGEVLQFLKNQDPEDERVFSIEGEPFYAFPRKHDGDFVKFFERLRDGQSVDIIPLASPYSVYGLQNKLFIEECIVSFQIDYLNSHGVVVEDYRNFFMEGIVPVGSGSSIATGVALKGKTSIGKNVKIFPHAYIEDSVIGDECRILPGCVVRGSRLESEVQIGPYSHLREGALVKKGAKMGNFVEMKKSVLGEGSKSMHLTYIGDADIGKGVNIGAGTITCNYDGVNKNKTIIEDEVFVGSGTQLVAPVTIGEGSYVGAGSTITIDVPPESLGVSRSKQRNLINWAKKRRKK